MHVLVTSQVLHPVIKVLFFKITEHAVWSQHRVQQTAFSTKANDTILIKKRWFFHSFLLGIKTTQHYVLTYI